MKKQKLAVSLLLAATLPSTASAVPFVVGPGDPRWAILSTDLTGVNGTGLGSGQYVGGPATPPSGTGSFGFTVPSGAVTGVQLRTDLFGGTTLSSLFAPGNGFSYSTFATDIGSSQQLPYATLWLDLNGDTVFDDRIYFEPIYSTNAHLGSGGQQANILLGSWQTWDLLTGNFYSDNFGGLFGPPSGLFTLTDYLSVFPNATVVNPGVGPNRGGFRLVSGYAGPTDSFATNADNLTFGANSFDFEYAVPELSLSHLSTAFAWVALALLTASSRRKA